jgi:PleD family two-component response regulator
MDNPNEVGIIIYDELPLSRHRVFLALQGYDIAIYEASCDIDLYNLLFNDNISIKLVLMDLGAEVSKGFRILAKVKELKPELPVFVITDNTKRQTFLRILSEGANAYIQKPFTDEFLLDKVLSALKRNRMNTAVAPSDFVFDIRSYLNRELKKAAKGKYAITVVMCTVVDTSNMVNSFIELKNAEAVSNFYYTVRSNLWETDLFERYGAQTFIGLFPYCNDSNVETLIQKLKDYFELSTSGINLLSNLKIAISHITYPTINVGPKELLLLLGTDMHEEIDDIKRLY